MKVPKSDVSVVGGAGHIGLPLSCYIASKGHKVTIIDTNEDVLKNLKNDNLPFSEVNLEEYWKLAKNNNIELSNKTQSIENSDFIVITLGSSSEIEDVKIFDSLLNDVLQNARPESKIILRSTINIQTIENIETNKLFIEKNLKLAYCPERIAEGMSLEELPAMPQIIGVKNDEDFQIFHNFFDSINISSKKTTFRNAVFLKLFTNTYRYAEFSLVNEFYNIAKEQLIDFDDIVSLAKDNYPRLKNLPSKGFVGGPCLIKDTKTFIKEYDKSNPLLSSIQNVNDKFFENIFNECLEMFENKTLIQLGLSFKPNSDDLRSSLSLRFYFYLIENGFKVYPVDKFVKSEEIKFYEFGEVENLTNNILIATYHDYFKKLNLSNKKVVTVGNK